MTNSVKAFIHDPSCTKHLRFSCNSEAFASELLENLEEIFARHYYMHNAMISMFIFLT